MDTPSFPPPLLNALPFARSSPTGSDRLWAVFCHLSWFFGVPLILPLVVYLVMRRDSEFVAANAREALNFHLSMIIYGIACAICLMPLSLFFMFTPLFLLFGGPFLLIFGLAMMLYLSSMILAIIAAVKASDDGCYHYPLTLRLVP